MKICLVCSHGGHLTEMRELEEAFQDHEICYVTYDSDRTRELNAVCTIDNFAAKPWTLPQGILKMIEFMSREKPEVVVSTGAEIAVPAFIIARLMGIKTIFVETCARVKSPSGSAMLAYPLSDYFFVQWKQLLRCFGKKARYEGGLL